MVTLTDDTSAEQPRKAIAESFGEDAAHYDRARPRYPRELVDRALDGLPGRTVLDVGCGTGIVARQFQEAGCEVLGVEPDPRMAAFAGPAIVSFSTTSIEGRSAPAIILRPCSTAICGMAPFM